MKVTKEVTVDLRPLRLLYLLSITVIAGYLFGWRGILLCLATTFDITFKK